MGDGHLGTLRINFYWGAVQPSGPQGYDWSHYDQVIGDAAANGIRVLPTVYGSPPWVARRPNLPPLGAHLGDFRRFVEAAAGRYGHDGTFWQQHPAIPRLEVDWWQLWNEVNSPSFWTRKPNPKQYVRLLRKFHAGIRAGDPQAQIVLAGLFPTPQVKHGMTGDRFLQGVYRNRAKPLFDATALHPYSTTPKQALARVRDMRRTMARYRDRKARLWLTEIGWATGGPKTALTVSSEATGRLSPPDLPPDGQRAQALQDPGSDLVLLARCPGRHLVPAHRTLHLRPPSEARLERLRGAHRRLGHSNGRQRLDGVAGRRRAPAPLTPVRHDRIVVAGEHRQGDRRDRRLGGTARGIRSPASAGTRGAESTAASGSSTPASSPAASSQSNPGAPSPPSRAALLSSLPPHARRRRKPAAASLWPGPS